MKRGRLLAKSKKDLYKRSQISIFIIIGILIVASISVVIYGYSVEKENANDQFFSQEDIKPQVENIQDNIFLCIDQVGRDSLDLIGSQGGYYDKPLKYYDVGKSFIPYYYNNGDYLMPDSSVVTKELEKSFDNKISDCYDGLNFSGFILEHGKSSSSILINKTSVIFEVDSSFTIKKDGKNIVFSTKDSPVKIESELGDILDVAKFITDSHKLDSKMYCIDCVNNLAEEKNLYVWSLPISNDSVYILIGENRTSYKPYMFNFLNKYNGQEISDDFSLNGKPSDGLPGGYNYE